MNLFYLTLYFKVLLMEDNKQHLEALGDIRSMMERSSRFISLSGLSGVFAGLFGLIGAGIAFWYFQKEGQVFTYYELSKTADGQLNKDFFTFIFADAGLVLLASLTVAIALTTRKANKKGQSIWDKTAKRLAINMMIPLITGGLFCLILFREGLVGLVAPCTLIFYGLALLNASKYTLNDIRYLGILEIGLGLLAACFMGFGLLFWALGFGVLHIIYGSMMYMKYEK